MVFFKYGGKRVSDYQCTRVIHNRSWMSNALLRSSLFIGFIITSTGTGVKDILPGDWDTQPCSFCYSQEGIFWLQQVWYNESACFVVIRFRNWLCSWRLVSDMYAIWRHLNDFRLNHIIKTRVNNVYVTLQCVRWYNDISHFWNMFISVFSYRYTNCGKITVRAIVRRSCWILSHGFLVI